MQRTLSWGLVLIGLASGAAPAAGAADFDDLALAAESYWNGAPALGSHPFASGGASFSNFYTYDEFYGMSYWAGWAYSSMTDKTTPDWTNQYSAVAGGAHGGQNYAVAYMDTWYGVATEVTLPAPRALDAAWFTNTTYAYFAMRDGTAFNKKFGGDTGADPDWLLLTITGKDAGGAVTGAVEFYLADFRFADPAEDYFVTDWTQVDLTPLGAVNSLTFALDGSDTGFFGLNTPAYFAMDTLVPEPATLWLAAAGLAAAALRRRRA